MKNKAQYFANRRFMQKVKKSFAPWRQPPGSAHRFTDTDRVFKRIHDDIAPKVAADSAYKNAKENTPHTARMAHDQALGKVMNLLLRDDTQVYKQFVENEAFRRSVRDMVYELTNQ